MKKTILLIFLLLSTTSLAAKNKALTLDEAVSQVKKRHSGQILSAKTYSNTHEIKILSANGKIKRIKIPIKSSKSKKNVRHNNNIYQRNRGHSDHRSSGHRNSNHNNSGHRNSGHSSSEKSKNK
ncbi:MAG: hypothetical protein L3J52_00030 [Proteobacteria bacterium]|nr:hypothetical protein [Pseudomonadota bacterium]